MSFINVDAKALEWMCALQLSKDAVGIKEWEERLDIHTVNQEAFHLPSRLIAKIYLFRLIYGGTAYAYSKDPDFADVKGDVDFWQKVIDKTYGKYKGLKAWHDKIFLEAISNGCLEMPTGRKYFFKKTEKDEWPRTQILNYPVQGLGADLMMLARVDLFKRLQFEQIGLIKFRGTVHDSIIIDAHPSCVETVQKAVQQTWRALPRLYEHFYGEPFVLECRYELKVGNNLTDMEVV